MIESFGPSVSSITGFFLRNRSRLWEHLGSRQLESMSCQGLLEVLKNGLLLQPESLRDRENAFNKSAAGSTVTTKGDFPPQHSWAYHAFSMIIGWLNATFIHKGPQGRFDAQEIFTECGRLCVSASAAFLQPGL